MEMLDTHLLMGEQIKTYCLKVTGTQHMSQPKIYAIAFNRKKLLDWHDSMVVRVPLDSHSRDYFTRGILNGCHPLERDYEQIERSYEHNKKGSIEELWNTMDGLRNYIFGGHAIAGNPMPHLVDFTLDLFFKN